MLISVAGRAIGRCVPGRVHRTPRKRCSVDGAYSEGERILSQNRAAAQRRRLFEDDRPQPHFVGGERPGEPGDAGAEDHDVPGTARGHRISIA